MDKYSAGIVLSGTEIKSIRSSQASISESFCEFNEKGELFVINMTVQEYVYGNYYNHAPKAERKLLLNKRELKKLEKEVQNSGLTIIPLRLFLNEKGYYFTILLFGLFSAVSVQKSVRDRLEGIPVTDIYYGISWFTTITSILLLVIGLWNADLELSEKGFYGMAFTLSLFAAIAVQKNTRDKKFIENNEG